MKNKLLAGIAAAIIAIAGIGGVVYFYSNNKTDTKPTSSAQTVKVDKISFSSDNKTVTYTGVEGQTALDTAISLTTVQTEDSAYGKMVTGINGVNAEKNKTYWAFYVNDTYANEGAATYKAKAGDKIKWQLEEIKL